MAVRALDFVGDSALQDHKHLSAECPLNVLHENLLGLKSVLIPVHIVRKISGIFFCGEPCQEKKRLWLVFPVMLTHTHNNLRP